MKIEFLNEFFLKNFLMNDNYYSWENYSFDETGYLISDERVALLKKQFPLLKNKFIMLKDIIELEKISLRSRVRWIVLEAMTKREALLFVFELIKIIIPLDHKNTRTYERVEGAGNKFFENEFKHKEFKEELHWLQNATQGVCQLNLVFPWTGYATDNFILAIECELQGGYMMYSSMGVEYKRDTKYFLNETIGYSFTTARELDKSMDKKVKTEVRRLMLEKFKIEEG